MQPSIAERFAYGTPLDPLVEDLEVHNAPRTLTALAGRIMLSAIFIISGFAKLTDPSAAVGYMNSAGVPSADVLVYIAGSAELLGGLALAFGFLARVAAVGLVALVILINYFMHGFWALDGAQREMQMAQFVKNLAIMGGLLMVVAHGPGRASIDARLRRPLQA
jgi:putative oxidoreductase